MADPGTRVEAARERARAAVEAARPALEARADRLTARVLSAMGDAGVGASDFAPSSGYGYDAPGRARLESVWARLCGAEAALVRPHVAGGSAAVALMLFAACRTGGELVIATGEPYDSVRRVVAGAPGSLAEWGVETRVLPYGQGTDPGALAAAIGPRTTCVHVQRSRGYDRRPSLPAARIGELAAAVHARAPHVSLTVDNCYGEFVEDEEPTALGADMCAGSWTKNPGGGLATTGGYVAGREALVRRAASRLYAPGQDGDVGAVPEGHRLAFQGLFLAPGAVAEALCAAVYASALFDALGFVVDPGPAAGARVDLVTRIELGDAPTLLAAARAIQAASPVDSRAVPEPGDMPGYADPVVMAAGTFVQGGGLELTADAPMRAPYDLFVQGGLRLVAARIALDRAAGAVLAARAARPLATAVPGGSRRGA